MKEVINEVRIDDDGRKYEYIEYDKKLRDGTPFSSKNYLPTEDEINAYEESRRIIELRQLISDKKLLDMDVKAEQQELKALLKL